MSISKDASYNDIGLCVLAGCNTEAVLRQSIASVLVREVAPNYHLLKDVVERRVEFQDDDNYIDKIIQVANTIRREHSEEEWENLRAEICGNFTRQKVLSCFHLSELVEAVEESWSVDHENCVDELIFGLLQLALQSKTLDRRYRYSFADLIKMVCPGKADTVGLPLFASSPISNPMTSGVCSKLHNVKNTRNNIVHDALHFTSERKQFEINYTRAVNFCITNFNCYPLMKETVLDDLQNITLNLPGYRAIKDAYEESAAQEGLSAEEIKSRLKELQKLKLRTDKALKELEFGAQVSGEENKQQSILKTIDILKGKRD